MKRAVHATVMRATLIEAAARLHGSVAELTISDVCREADVTRPTFSQYFGSIDALLAAVAFQRLRALVAGADEVGASLFEALRHDDLLRHAVTAGGAQARRAAIDYLAVELMARLGLDADDPADVLKARFAAAGVVEANTWWLAGGDPGLTGQQLVGLATACARAVADTPRAARQ
jgi:AcrR family transcriptional regulator